MRLSRRSGSAWGVDCIALSTSRSYLGSSRSSLLAFDKCTDGREMIVITSYSIHYTKLYDKREWDQISAGLKQRVNALNRFIDDVYHEQKAFADGVLPRAYIEKSLV